MCGPIAESGRGFPDASSDSRKRHKLLDYLLIVMSSGLTYTASSCVHVRTAWTAFAEHRILGSLASRPYSQRVGKERFTALQQLELAAKCGKRLQSVTKSDRSSCFTARSTLLQRRVGLLYSPLSALNTWKLRVNRKSEAGHFATCCRLGSPYNKAGKW